MRVCYTLVALLCYAAWASAEAFANQPAKCRVVQHRAHSILYVQSRWNHGTRIQLPKALLIAPVNSAPTLWDVQGIPQTHHVFVKPATKLPEGKSTSFSLITVDNNAYDVVVTRVDGPGDYCVIIQTYSPFGAINELTRAETERDGALRQAQEQMATLKETIDEKDKDAEKRAVDSIVRYQQNIFSDYEFDSKSFVKSVWDDGRFTNIRLAIDGYGKPIVYGLIDGEEMLIEYNEFDSQSQVVVVSGLYDGFRVVHGKRVVKIARGTREYAKSFWGSN